LLTLNKTIMPNAVRIDTWSITFNAGNGNAEDNPVYDKQAITEVIAQTNCSSIRFINAVVHQNGVDIDATFAVGVASDGTPLIAGDNLMAPPCPNWCKS
jgi:hypothetical protein